MSTRKQRQHSKKTKKKQQRKKSSSGDIPPQKKGDDMTALKSMGYGALIFVVLAAFFFLRVGGDTPFNHLVGLFASDAKPAATDSHTPEEQKALDDLVDSRTKQK